MKIASDFAFLGILRNARAAASAIITARCYIRRTRLCGATVRRMSVCLSVRLCLSGVVIS